MVNFLLLIEKSVKYSKIDIDGGKTPLDIYKICSVIRETFCLSYAIRKENNLYIYIKEEDVLIHFEGNFLRYLGPDERSQALLLQKAIDKSIKLPKDEKSKWLKSTPGIYVKKLTTESSLILELKKMNLQNIAVIVNSISPLELSQFAHTYNYPKIKKFHSLKNLNEFFYVIPVNSSNNSLLLKFLSLIVETFPSMLEILTLVTLKKITNTQDIVLYINFQVDQTT